MPNMGRNIAGAREMRGWDQGHLAAAMGEHGVLMSARTLGRIERGEREARANEVAAIAKAVSAPVTWFYTGPDWLESDATGPYLAAAS